MDDVCMCDCAGTGFTGEKCTEAEATGINLTRENLSCYVLFLRFLIVFVEIDILIETLLGKQRVYVVVVGVTLSENPDYYKYAFLGIVFVLSSRNASFNRNAARVDTG